MYIPQNTTIHILENVPLNSDYENTVMYPDLSSQVQGFLKYKKFSLEKYSYQRANLDTIKVQLPYESVYKCNYLMFKNTNYENKWFFCFIENVSYISNNVTAIYYKEDVMQTWCYDYQFLDSFVERRHSTKDTIYGNIQPEGLDIGQYYREIKHADYSLKSVIIFCILMSDINGISFTEHTSVYRHGLLNGVYNGLYLLTIPQGYSSELDTLISSINSAGKENAVTAFYEAPALVASEDTGKFTIVKSGALGGYTPRNKKLYTSPYHVIQVTNNCGQSVTLNPEQINGDDLEYKVQHASFPNAGSRWYPSNYKGIGNPINYSVIYLNYPVCSFAGNSFQLWWSQNKNSYLQSLNAIDATYDANQRIAQNNYDAANRSARVGMEQSSANISAQQAIGESALNTAQTLTNRDANYRLRGAYIQAGKGDPVGAVQTAADIDHEYVNDQINYAHQRAAADMAAGTALANAQLSYDNTLRNNAITKANSNIANLTSKNNAVNSLMAKKKDIENIPNTAKLNASADTLNWAFNNAEFYIGEYCLQDEYLRKIDDYFTCYGYNESRLMKASELNDRINRKHYSYLRTVGCNVKGNLNDQDQTAIRSIYDNGITTWDNLEDVGNYDLDNSVK